MARKKSKKDGVTGEMPDLSMDTAQAEAPAPTVEKSRGMPYSTAVLAIILAFVLGAVVGSVAPQLLQPQKAVVAQAPAAQAGAQAGAAQQKVPAQAASPQQGHDMHVIQDLEKQLARNPANRQLYVALGNACFDAHLHERAIQAYEKALELDPKDADVLTDVGIMYREVHAFDTALARFRQAQVVDPGHINAAFNEGVVLYYDLNSRKEALARWQRLLDANPAAVAPNGKPLADLIRELQ